MTYYYCSYCGTDFGNFPQVYVMLNSKIKHDWKERDDNLFEVNGSMCLCSQKKCNNPPIL